MTWARTKLALQFRVIAHLVGVIALAQCPAVLSVDEIDEVDDIPEHARRCQRCVNALADRRLAEWMAEGV